MPEFGIKELYQVVLRANTQSEFGGIVFEPREVILSFDKVQIAQGQTIKTQKTAHGGYNDAPLVTWEQTKEMDFVLSEGVFSKKSLALLSNAKLIPKPEAISVPVYGEFQAPIDGIVTLNHTPNGIGFLYNAETGVKIASNLNQKTFSSSVDVYADYYYNYLGGIDSIEIGNNALVGFVTLEGKMRLKDDYDGHDKTAIITMPKVKIASSFNIRLGRNAEPLTGNFNFISYPVGMRGSQTVCNIQILNDDIDSDF